MIRVVLYTKNTPASGTNLQGVGYHMEVEGWSPRQVGGGGIRQVGESGGAEPV